MMPHTYAQRSKLMLDNGNPALGECKVYGTIRTSCVLVIAKPKKKKN